MVLMVYLHVQDAKGNDVDLSTYKGKVLLIVNVASRWYPSSTSFPCTHMVIVYIFLFTTVSVCVDPGSGMTNSNYRELNQLYEKYKDHGLHL